MEDVGEPAHHLYAVRHLEDAGAARRAVARCAADAGIPAPLLPRAELVATELGTNIARHAPEGGHVLARPIRHGGALGFELLAVDRGPGIRDLGAALDGTVQSAKGLGCGLAAVRRMAGTFDAFTAAGRGTVVVARLLADGGPAEVRWSGVSVAAEGQDQCGDAWAVVEDGGVLTALVVDGLGHGPEAARAARAAMGAFASSPNDPLEVLAERIHGAMHETRGGAVALCRFLPESRHVEFLGVGNVAGRVYDDGRTHALVPSSGTMGTGLVPARLRRIEHTLEDPAAIILNTDGIRDGFGLGDYPGLLSRDPAVVAATIHRDNLRGADDATVVVLRPPTDGAR